MPVAIPGLPRTAALHRRPDRQYAADPPVDVRGGSPQRRAVRQGRVEESRRLGEGSAGGPDDCRRRAIGRADARQDHPRRDVGQHRHRLRDDRRGARLSRPAVRAGERDAGAEADSAARSARRSSSPIRCRDPTAPSSSAQDVYAAEPDLYFYRGPVQQPGNWRAHYDTTAPEIIEQTGGRLTHFVAGLGTSGTFIGVGPAAARVQSVDPADLGAARFAAARPRRAEAHGDGDRARASTIRRWPTRTSASVTEEAFELTRQLARRTACSSASRAAPTSRRRFSVARRDVGRGDRRGLPRRRREVPVRALLGRRRERRDGR